MGETTGISWTDHTYNLAWGCTKISPGCDNCYADTQSARYGFQIWGKDAPRRTFGQTHWNEPLKWNTKAKASGVRRRVFTSSMADVFEDHPTIDAEREKLWPLIRATPYLDWLVLTKRAGRIRAKLPSDWGSGYRNVWMGVSVESNEYLWRVSYLREVPATVRFVSYEPALGPIDRINLAGIDWMIVGGESGRNHRPMDAQWARDVQTRCKQDGVAFFFKQGNGLKSGSHPDLLGGIFHESPVART